jgi:hypothetical protein
MKAANASVTLKGLLAAVTVLTLLRVEGLSQARDAGPAPSSGPAPQLPAGDFAWQQREGSIALTRQGAIIWQFNYGTNQPKPFFHPLALPGGPVLTADRPPDHPWHHALWFSWKFINDLNYWEPNPGSPLSEGRTEWQGAEVTTARDFSARIAMDLRYRPAGKDPVLTEHRAIEVSPPDTQGVFHLDWTMTFTAASNDVVLNRTPIPGQPGGVAWGGYAGLSVRFANALTDARALSEAGLVEFSEGTYRGKASAMDYSGVVQEKEAGIAIIDHPDNLNHPSPWYVIRNTQMRYFSPAVICFQPHTIPASQSLRLRYRVIVHPGRWEQTDLRQAMDGYAKGKSSAGGPWFLPEPRDVQLHGALGEAYARAITRLGLPPYDSPLYLRSDFSFETNRIFVNYSGDISGRFIQIASLVSPPGQMTPPTLPQVLRDFAKYQKPDGHFGRAVDWNQPLEPENPNAVLLPIFWGNSRLLVGLVEADRAFGREDCLAAARRLGDFYIATASRFLDPAREAEYRMTGTYAAGYPTDYFPGIEGLALLYQVTRDERYLLQAERMADFFKRFDTLPIEHSHGNLVTHYGLLLLYEATGKQEYLERPLAQWKKAVEGGFVWPLGGVGERFRVSCGTDEGCSEADWLRLNLRLWALTGENRFLDLAERLIWNHYAMNRTANGGYGHHTFVCDDQGPLLMKPQFTEAVWCCTFHGLVGLHTVKSHLIAGSPEGVFINFPISADAPLRTANGRWRVSVDVTEPTLGELRCRVRLDPIDGATQPPPVFVRRPSWAARVTVADSRGQPVGAEEENGRLRLSPRSGVEGETTVTFAGPPRVEDRRLRAVTPGKQPVTRQSGVTLLVGPHLLLANADKPRPVLVARVGRNGQLIWPSANCFPRVARLDATEEQIAQAAVSPDLLELRPWETINRQAPVAFVFDLITLPEDSPLLKPGR